MFGFRSIRTNYLRSIKSNFDLQHGSVLKWEIGPKRQRKTLAGSDNYLKRGALLIPTITTARIKNKHFKSKNILYCSKTSIYRSRNDLFIATAMHKFYLKNINKTHKHRSLNGH